MEKFHIGANGPAPCKAEVRACPIGGTHFDLLDDAQRAFEREQEASSGLFSSVKKRFDPHTAHVRKAAQRVKAIERELARDAERHGTSTLYAKHASHELDELVALPLALRESGVGILQANGFDHNHGYSRHQEFGPRNGWDPVIGISYTGDYKTEEESGIPRLATALREGRLPADAVRYREEGGVGVLTVVGPHMGQDHHYIPVNEESAVDSFTNGTDTASFEYKWELENKKLSELRSMLREAELPPVRTKEEAVTALISVRGPYIRHGKGSFSTGNVLSIAADNPTMKKLMAEAVTAHASGDLRLGNCANKGVVFYDQRDVSRDDRVARIYREEALSSATEYVQDTKARLQKHGIVFAVSPKVDETLTDVRDASYTVNFSRRHGPQHFGRYTKAALEKFIDELDNKS